jgi:hypothetical protein
MSVTREEHEKVASDVKELFKSTKTKTLTEGNEREVKLVYSNKECGCVNVYLISHNHENKVIGQWSRFGPGQPLPFLITGRVSPHDSAEYPRLMQWNDQADFEELAIKELVAASVNWNLYCIGFVPMWDSSSVPVWLWHRDAHKGHVHESDDENDDDDNNSEMHTEE